jgi:hypothetical protein
MALKFCSLHRIGYNDQLDPTCPQCGQRGTVAPQLDRDAAKAQGIPVERIAPAQE